MMAELQRILERRNQLETQATLAHQERVQAREEAAQSMSAQQATAVVERLSSLPNEVADAMAKASSKGGGRQPTD